MQDLTGKKFNNLTVLGFSHRKEEKYFWKCKCDCGKETIVESYRLRKGLTKSCGCLRVTSNTKHGTWDSKLYRIYYGMLARCYKPQDKYFKSYGGKGITVCKEWKENYINFKNWAMANNYKEGLSIDRIDSNKNYEPLNCRWVTLKEQGRNKKNVKLILYKGKEYYISDLAEMFNINRSTLYNRLKTGWDIEKALTTKNQRGTR